MKKVFLTKLLFLFSIVILQAQVTEKQIQDFDFYIQQAAKDWNVPGMAVAVVKDKKIILQKGYGFLESGKEEKVDTQTLFVCASTTKAMTAACMAMLVDEGKIKWSDKVINYLPDFQLYDAYITRELSIKDLFIHDCGVGNTDFLWTLMQVSSDEILKRMRLVEPTYSLRSNFIYQNIFYLAAGKVIEKVSGMSWEQFIRKRIFETLKMSRTFPMKKETLQQKNVSSPHAIIDGKIQVIQDSDADAIGPAGSVWSCIEDMAKWLACMLDSSKYEGGRLLQPQTWAEILKPQTLVPPNQFYPTMQLTKPKWTSYGLGWFQQDYKGQKIDFHTGSLSGRVAINAMISEQNLGIYVFANLNGAELRHALMFRAFDHFALGGERDWNREFLTLYKDLREKAEKQEKEFEAKRILNTKTSLPLEAYSGKYSSPLYGEIAITLEKNKLIINANNFIKASLSHWHYDTFRGNFEKSWFGKLNAVFNLNQNGQIEKVKIFGFDFIKNNKTN